MKRLFNYLLGRNIHAYSADWAGVLNEEERAVIISPHKLLRIENVVCTREERTVRLEFSLRNMGDEIVSYGIKMINNFDPEGQEHEYSVIFGKNQTSNGLMLQYTLPHDIPIKVAIEFYGVAPSVKSIAQIKLAGLCVRKSRNKGYRPSGSILLRNIAIAG